MLKQVYQDFREALKYTKGVFTTLDREDKDTGGVTETSSTDKQDRIAWVSQQSLTRALQYTARLAQGVPSTAKVVETPLAHRTAQESSCRFLKPAVFFSKEAFCLRVDLKSTFQPRPPQTDASVDGVAHPTNITVPYAWFTAMEEFSRRAAIYASISEAVFGSLINTMIPIDSWTRLQEE